MYCKFCKAQMDLMESSSDYEKYECWLCGAAVTTNLMQDDLVWDREEKTAEGILKGLGLDKADMKNYIIVDKAYERLINLNADWDGFIGHEIYRYDLDILEKYMNETEFYKCPECKSYNVSHVSSMGDVPEGLLCWYICEDCKDMHYQVEEVE